MGLSMKRHIVFLLITLAAAQAFAAGYPSRQIRIVTPFQPGGGSTSWRACWQATSAARLGQQTVIDNRSGRLTCSGSRASGARYSENRESKPISVLVAQM